MTMRYWSLEWRWGCLETGAGQSWDLGRGHLQVFNQSSSTLIHHVDSITKHDKHATSSRSKHPLGRFMFAVDADIEINTNPLCAFGTRYVDEEENVL